MYIHHPNTYTYIHIHPHPLPLPTSAKRLRLNYDRSLFGMKFSDAESLSMCLENTATLVSLRWGPHTPSDISCSVNGLVALCMLWWLVEC